MNNSRTILSLFDFSGAWSKPYREAGYNVIQVELKLGSDVLLVNEDYVRMIAPHGILAAPPCTDFSGSGAQYWPAKDADGRTAQSVALVKKALEIVKWAGDGLAWWALEQPIGRTRKLIPELGEPWYWQPHWFGDAYTKKSILFGDFNRDLPRNKVDPIKVCSQGSWLMKLGGKSEKTKELRSVTPAGFANAFFRANP